MEIRDFSAAFYEEAERVLEGFREWSLSFMEYEFGAAIPYRLDFHEWISDLEDYLDVGSMPLKGEERFQTIKRFFPTLEDIRIQHLIENPQSITEDESIEWRKNWHHVDKINSDILVLVPLNLNSGESGSVIIRCYSNITGGEFDISGVFASIEDGKKYLRKNCF